ncbi:MAG TPA: dTDP-4-dehydrorhamnose reductase [Bacilli bacterium]
MKVIVTGAQGQLGVDMVRCLQGLGYEVYGYGRKELDVTDFEQVRTEFEKIKPDTVIHTAAYTKVDLAESAPEEAYRINAYGTRNVAVVSEQLGAKLVYISTDYVFNGYAGLSNHEFHPTNPVNVYGWSKLAGEQFVQNLHTKFFIVRTSWVYGMHGHNFVKTMLELAAGERVISVVADQIGSPTYTVDLASCISNLITTSKHGIYHVSNSGQCSWYEFAKAIFEISRIDVNLVSVTTEDYQRPAQRPVYSVLDAMSLKLNGFKELRHWRDALEHFLNKEVKVNEAVEVI